MQPLPPLPTENDKPALRDQLKEKRQAMTAETVELYSTIIIKQIKNIVDWAHIKRVHIYVPIEAFKEVNTWPLLEYIWQGWPEIKVAVPDPFKSKETASVFVDRRTTWKFGNKSLQPVDAYPVTPNILFDLFIIPMIGFDSDGFRLGYGGGYYDKLLKTQKQAKKIGVGYEISFIEDGLPRELHDVPMERIVTEERVLSLI